jgi:hypothetical protein
MEKRKPFRISQRQSDKRPLARYTHGWKDNIKMDLKEKGCDYLDCNHMVQDRKK